MSTLTSPPNTIYLNISDDPEDHGTFPADISGVTWSTTPDVSCTVMYVKATRKHVLGVDMRKKVNELKDRVAFLEKALEGANSRAKAAEDLARCPWC
jgi:hypothetical protein